MKKSKEVTTKTVDWNGKYYSEGYTRVKEAIGKVVRVKWEDAKSTLGILYEVDGDFAYVAFINDEKNLEEQEAFFDNSKIGVEQIIEISDKPIINLEEYI